MARIESTDLQDVCDSLEEYKRLVGRKYDLASSHVNKVKFCNKYNKLENQIRYLVDIHGCERSSKPYKISIKEL